MIWDVITSLKLTIVCLALLMLLVVVCTLAQVDLGTLGAVNAFMRSWFVWVELPSTPWSIPVLPGGALVGLVLTVNLVAAQVRRIELRWTKAGLWIAHAGLVLLVAGEFVSSAMQVDSQLAIEEGQTIDFIERPKELELALVDMTDPAADDVYMVPDRLLARSESIGIPGTPVTLRVRGYYKNAQLTNRTPQDPHPIANRDLGAQVTVREIPPVVKDDDMNRSAAFVEPVVAGQSQGVWLASNALGKAQTFSAGGRTYALGMRARREYLGYSVTLKDFRHDVYAGTDIPMNFSSLVHLKNPAKGEERDVLIYMNQPLRYGGKTFYQASFGKGDTLSVLQVVENPGWLLPYISTVLVTLGLLVHFAISLRRGVRRSQAALEATP
jgi:hypothetical protein